MLEQCVVDERVELGTLFAFKIEHDGPGPGESQKELFALCWEEESMLDEGSC